MILFRAVRALWCSILMSFGYWYIVWFLVVLGNRPFIWYYVVQSFFVFASTGFLNTRHRTSFFFLGCWIFVFHCSCSMLTSFGYWYIVWYLVLFGSRPFTSFIIQSFFAFASTGFWNTKHRTSFFFLECWIFVGGSTSITFVDWLGLASRTETPEIPK